MRFIKILVISILLFSCHSFTRQATFLPEEYYLPENQINNGKTYIYLNRTTGDTSYFDNYFGVNNGRQILIHKSYSLKGTDDSSIYLHRKLIEVYAYWFNDSQITKANILQDTIVENGKRLGKRISTVSYESDSIIWKIIIQSEFLKDTTFTWKGKPLSTLVINTTYNTTIRNKFDNNLDRNFKLMFNTYEAKKIGTVRMKAIITADHRPKDIDLIEIKDISRN